MVLEVTREVTDRLRPLLGFSRVLQATLSVAQPFAVGLIALHGFPAFDRFALAISAGWAGFMAVFALNDLFDAKLDEKRFEHLRGYEAFDIDSALVRHPLAQGQISFATGTAWIGAFAAYALVAGYILNPVTVILFVFAGLLEAGYCKLARVTSLKFLVSGLMVAVGALAGWLAMTPEIRPAEMAVIFVWMFAWEIGGRNIVNDFADVEEDARLGVKTIPLVLGPRVAAGLNLAFLALTAAAGLILGLSAQLGPLYLALSTVAAVYLLLWPGLALVRAPLPHKAMALFNRASLYPPAMVAVIIASLYLPL